jgi:hypothetical protein
VDLRKRQALLVEFDHPRKMKCPVILGRLQSGHGVNSSDNSMAAGVKNGKATRSP